jgi:predicted short-subunit dehydrogenase-like oxidoreductase (DUF2520 family)
MPKKISIAIIGRGRVGTSLAERIEKMKSYELHSNLSARKKSFDILKENNGPDVIFICSKDDKIADVAKKAIKAAGKNLKLMAHCAGSKESTILPQVGQALSLPAVTGGLKVRPTEIIHPTEIARLTLHPIQTFPKANAKLLKNIYYMASTKDAYAKKWAKKFVNDIGGDGVIEVKGKDLALYHTLVVFASNFTILIGGAIEILSSSLHIPSATIKKAVAPLMETSLKNVLHGQAKKVLTGPLARKDYSTILKHRITLKKHPPALRKIYEGFVMLAQNLS